MFKLVPKSVKPKKKILEEVKKLTNHGKHKEASELFQIYFPDITGGTDGKN